MRIVIDLDGTRESVELRAFQPHATVADLVAQTGGTSPAADDRLFLDGAAVTAESKLQELVMLEGSVLSRQEPERVERIVGWSVSIAAGVDAGEMVTVPDHRRLIVGRAPQADLVLVTDSASWYHCTIEREADGLRLCDAGSTNGTLVDGGRVDEEGVLISTTTTVLVGGAAMTLRRSVDELPAPAPGSLPNLTAAGTAPFNRPPRPGRPAAADALAAPTPKDVPPASKFNLITIAAPLVMAGVLVVVLGDARFAMFALLSPVMAIGMYFEQRRRRTKNLAEEETRFTAALDDFRSRIAEASIEEVERRRAMIPDPSLVMRRPALPSTTLWQRREGAADFLSLHVGVGDVPWMPDLDTRSSARVDDRVRAVLDETRLRAAPVLADLNDAGVVGIVGDRAGALALARSFVVQAAVHCGPADLTIGVFCDSGRERDWDWAGWLPHTRQAGVGEGSRWLSSRREGSTSMLRGLLDRITGLPTPAMLIVLDSEVLTEGRDSPARDLLGIGRRATEPGGRAAAGRRTVSGIVIADTAHQLPASCTTVIEVGPDAAASVHRPEDATRVDDVVVAGVGLAEAERCARTLAHFEDPELVLSGASLPSLVRLPELLGADPMDAATVRELWKSPGMSAPIGMGEQGPLSIDVVADGPHGLVGGTTGSGKSEFLRSFIAGLAARNDPTTLNFILIDFKGGAAFAACERLPHTIGTISNLDEQLADRALRALEAEMERRQRLFAQAGEDIDNLPAYLATHPAEPLPRLLLVIDEFAMLAKDFPEVLASLVTVAAVGRTLGVHMILATQRPAGVVNDDILANTNLRVALRVQSREDSTNVIGVPSASSIGRAQTGRAYVKLGQDDITPVQTALVTGRARASLTERVDVRALGAFGVPVPPIAEAPLSARDANDLDQLIDAVVAANEAAGFSPPRQVWPEALGDRVSLAGYETDDSEARQDARSSTPVGGTENGVVRVALADEPDQQRQRAVGWNLADGNLLLMGIVGSGTTSTLASIALALADSMSPEDLDLLCLDVGSRDLSALKHLPHTVAYVGAGSGSKELRVRFLRHLTTELRRRRESKTRPRTMVILIDGLAALRDEFAEDARSVLDAFYRVYADGPAVGMHFAIATTRTKAIPAPIDELTTQRWVYRLADVHDYSLLGIRGKAIPASVAGRCVDSSMMLQMHIATPDHGVAAAIAEVTARWAHVPPKPEAIGSLPSRVAATAIASSVRLTTDPIRIPVGIREDTLGPAVLELYEGEHLLIAGPVRSGKSSLLLAIAEMLRSLPEEEERPEVWGICGRRSPLATATLDRLVTDPLDVSALASELLIDRGRVFLLVDDAEGFGDASDSIKQLVLQTPPRLRIIGAARPADMRAAYGHWAKAVALSRCGVLLQPEDYNDGEVFGGTLPRNPPVALTTGRGYACSAGTYSLLQSASPTESDPALGDHE